MSGQSYVRSALDTFERYGPIEAMVAIDGRRISYAELRARTLDTAAALWRQGIRPGMTLGMLVSNTPESYYTQFAAHLIGCRTAYLARIMAHYFLRDVLSFVKADAFVYEVSTSAEMGRRLAEESGVPPLCIGAGGLGPDLAAAPRVDRLPFDPDETLRPAMSVFQTSGTTGTPKLLEHGERFFRSVPSIAAFYRPPDRPIRHLLGTGTWHAAGQAAGLLTLMTGGCCVIQFGWDIDEVLERIATERVTSINLPPVVLAELLDHPRLAGADLSSLFRVTVSGSATSPTRLIEAAERFGAALNVPYGMSELPFISVLADVAETAVTNPERLTSCGRPWGDVRLEIRDPDGKPLPAGEVGEICVTSDLLTEGYFGQPELTADRIVDGWLRTNDGGRVDEDGYLYIVDRLTDVIVTGAVGENIYPRPIEDVLATHPEVRGAAVLGVPDEELGEAVHAYVVLAPGAKVTREELRAYVTDAINEAWTPQGIDPIDEFPLTETGKVDKKQLRARYLAGAGS